LIELFEPRSVCRLIDAERGIPKSPEIEYEKDLNYNDYNQVMADSYSTYRRALFWPSQLNHSAFDCDDYFEYFFRASFYAVLMEAIVGRA
jgi:hypothetical protein